MKWVHNTLNQLSGITTATTEYSFTYDNFGNTTSIKAGDRTLATYAYNANNGKMSSMTYGNGTIVTYVYDTLDRLEKVCYNYVVRYEYQYTSDGKLHCVNDYQSGVGYLYGYNVEGKLSEYTQYDLDDMTNELAIAYKYNDRGQIEQVSSSFDYTSFYNTTSTLHLTEYYAYDDVDPMTFLLEEYSVTSDARLLAGTYVPSDFTINFEYDGLQRLTRKTTNLDGLFDFTHEISYAYADRSSGKLLSSQVETYSTQVGNNAEKKYTYTYDANGNITKIVDNSGNITKYTYDNLGQLIREDNPYLNKTYVYTYDNNGNRTSMVPYAYTTGELGAVGWAGIYSYGDDTWDDLLTMYSGMSITYDEIGNPLSYYNGTRYNFTWSDGRRLTSATKAGSNSYSFTYNDEGIRMSKTSNGVTHYYTLDGTRIVSEEWGNYFAVYVYDESGSPIGMHIRQNWTTANEFHTYYFEKNLQGDIIGVYNSGGTLVYSYAYDAWGNFTATSHSTTDTYASYNPFRYRGYYYDSDLGFYYLNSRYYDPITGRFISPDRTEVLGLTPGQLTDKNLFAYCDNNPVMRVDHGGRFWETVFDVISLGASIIEVCVNPADVWSWAGLVGDAIDLIPFVTGAGEITRAVKTTVKVVDKTADVVDTAHDLYKAADVADDIRKATGSYEILYKSGKNYIGKGGFKRAINSAIRNADKYGDEVTSIMWKSAPNDRAAFIDEYLMQKRFGGVLSSNKDLPTYNRIWSPGRRYFGD